MYWPTIVLLLLLGYNTLSREVSRGNRPRPSQRDACPHLEKHPGNKIQLYFITINGTERQCCGCPAGYRVAGLCSKDNITDTLCEPCEDGTYITDMAHDKQTCNVDDLICPVGLDKINAEYDSAPRCECPPGQFMNGNGMCQPHSTCPPGEGVDRLGTSERNTACKKCRSGYESPNDSGTDPCVRKTKNKIPQTKTGSNTTTRANATLCPSPEKQALSVWDITMELWSLFFFSLCVSFIVGVIAMKLSMKCMGTKQKSCCQRLRKQLNGWFCNAYTKGESLEMAEEDAASLRGDDNRLEDGVVDSNETISGSNDRLLGGAGQQTVQSEIPQQRNTGTSPVATTAVMNPLFPGISSYHSKMNDIKLELQNDVDDVETYGLYRHFIRHVMTSIQQGKYIKDIQQRYTSQKERFFAVFENLVEKLGSENFNPTSIYQHFNTTVENRHLAELVEPFLPHD